MSNMNKPDIIKKIKLIQIKKNTIQYYIIQLLIKGILNDIVDSAGLAHLINEEYQRKIKPSDIVACIKPIVSNDILRSLIIKKGKRSYRYWYPAWIAKDVAISRVNKTKEKVLFITGHEAWSDQNKRLKSIFDILEGEIDIIDPYYGYNTLHALSLFGKTRKVRFLTCNTGNSEKRDITNFNLQFARFKKEFRNILFKQFALPEIHDRYILSKNAIVIIGHGIKDIGNKESFVIYLEKELVSKILPTLRKLFNLKWSNSINI